MFDRFKKLRFEHIRYKRPPNNKNFGVVYYLGRGGMFFIRGKGLISLLSTSRYRASFDPARNIGKAS